MACRPTKPTAADRAHHWIMEALAAGYDGEALICDYAITALAAETGCTDADAMTAVTRAWHNLTPTRAI